MKRVVAFLMALICCLGLGAIASTDTVISLSYLEGTIAPQMEQDIKNQVVAMFKTPAQPPVNDISRDGMVADVANRALERLQMKGYYMYSTNGREKIVLKKDDVLSGLTGTTFIMREGSATVINDAIINITKGESVKAGTVVPQSTNFMIPTTSGAGIRITSDRATVWVDGVYRVVSIRYRAKYFECADALKVMNLFRGSNIGYELDRGATRAEALVMLLRLLGEEDEALSYTGGHPFTDVPDWAKNYVAYAYSKGYTNGISNTLFGSNNTTTANHYMTFLLRALGYNDAEGDFKWDKAVDFAKSIGNITAGEHKLLTTSSFMRDHMAYVSYYALFAQVKNEDFTLLQKLTADGTVSKSVASSGITKVIKPRL